MRWAEHCPKGQLMMNRSIGSSFTVVAMSLPVKPHSRRCLRRGSRAHPAVVVVTVLMLNV